MLKLRKDIPAKERGNKEISWHATVGLIILTVVVVTLGVGVALESIRRKSDELNVVLFSEIDELRNTLREYEETNYRVRKKYGSAATTYNEREHQKIRDLGYIE